MGKHKKRIILSGKTYMKRPVFLKQKIMVRVLYALAPIAVVSVYFFGWRILTILVVANIFAFLTEWVMESRSAGKVSMACFVTATIYGLSLPPTTPFWIIATGAIVALLFGKEVFGGFGKNIFNPAIVGRAFVYVAFPVELTARFVPVFSGFPGGFAHWSFSTSAPASYLIKAGHTITDAITAATPMWSRRDFGFVTGIKNLFIGNIGETFHFSGHSKVLAAGSIGEVCALAIILSALYLIITKTAKWQLILSTILGATLFNVILRNLSGIEAVPPLDFSLFSGALLFAAVFMVTDPISAPKQPLSQWVYGIFIGMMIIFFRYKSIFAGGVGFSILLGNMLAPSFDYWIKKFKDRKKEEAAQ